MSSTRRPLQQKYATRIDSVDSTNGFNRTNSQTNAHAGIRLVSPEPPLLLGSDDSELQDNISLHWPEHTPAPEKSQLRRGSIGGRGEFHTPIKPSQPPAPVNHVTQIVTPAKTLTATKRNPLPKKRLVVRIRDNQKTFSLIAQDPSPQKLVRDESPPIKESIESSPASTSSAVQGSAFPSESTLIATPSVKSQQSTLHDTTSPWNYKFVGGLRKVAKTPDLKHDGEAFETRHPPLPETSIITRKPVPLSTKASFLSIDSVTTVSENTNYKVYRDRPAHTQHPSISESEAQSPISVDAPSFSDPELEYDSAPQALQSDVETASISQSIDEIDHLVRELSLTPESVIHHRLSEDIEDENYIVHGEASPAPQELAYPAKARYSQESLVVRPLRPRTQRSKESFGYFKQRSRETLRTVGSFTSISSVLSHQEASHAIVGTGSVVTLPFPPQSRAARGTFTEPSSAYQQRFPMNETPHVWSSQLSTVLSVSDASTRRGSRTWSDEAARRSSGTPRAMSRNSRHLLNLHSEGVEEEDELGSPSMGSPREGLTPGLQRYLDEPPAGWFRDQAEQEDIITPMQDLRTRSSRRHLAGYANIDGDTGRSNTMKSTASSIANSVLATSIPAWAQLYYGSGERKYLGHLPRASTEASLSRSNSYLTNTGSPYTDHFPNSLHSPRRRPREGYGRYNAGSMDGSPSRGRERVADDPYSRRLRSWSMSSMWSPHLRHDRRANNRISIWEPPTVTWATEGKVFGRRNMQIVLFLLGFIFPFCEYSPRPYLWHLTNISSLDDCSFPSSSQKPECRLGGPQLEHGKCR